MADIVFENITKSFGDTTVVDEMNLTIKDGSFTVIVGPSGCGKSTTLRMIAGLEKQTSGNIFIGGRCVNETAPGKRDIAMVFQNYALYPTMTVRGNIEFGLVNKKVPKAERQALIQDICDIVGLTPFLDKKPQSLSGGQRQRVALARAMVKKPSVFILDEPLSNLDAKLRGQMRTELVQLHQRLGTTFVYVTHDQVEAMSMGDEIVLMDKGVIQQADTPMKVYHQPRNVFTAEFIGTPAMNIFPIEDLASSLSDIPKKTAFVGFRPEYGMLSTEMNADHSITMISELITVEPLGSETIYQFKSGRQSFYVKTFLSPVHTSHRLMVHVPKSRLYFFDVKGERVISGIEQSNVSLDQEMPLVAERA
ncbi:ABC transporter ATP-binding protein [Aureibacillus halotolerans]|uniref:Carbohydrate ABC transporter ATP-binding protein (CUT1 family) n=1 Tax=Aureibacillus halotolerans TaxID=1508390 RepID=A0A4R6UAG8_9BACI|nr:ABC transporter ATP-binding protein [Aureibacillus halotolerans]TDQ42846.1 carbohydrate ABC transporter ATP-binding protein (CUT1 family) [Aureibacillus halotolerans]